MTQNSITPEMIALVPELAEWGDCDIDIEFWVAGAATYSVAVGLSRLFWPEFLEFEDYILRAHQFSEDAMRSWEEATGGNKIAIEAVLNHVHVTDLFHNDQTGNETQVIDIGRTLQKMWRAKLAVEFPDRKFVVEFDDTPGRDLLTYEVTFWQVRA